jgi:HEXXH motif-containing protein
MRLHHLSDPVLHALNSVTEDEGTVAFLLDAESSRRLLLLRAILDAAADADDVRRAWRLLEAAERAAPAVFRTQNLPPGSERDFG